MFNIKEIMEILKSHKNEFEEKYGIKEIGIFGSYVRGENSINSDIDILVEFKEEYKTFDNYMNLKFYLTELLGKEIDLISKTALKSDIKKEILEEVFYV